MASITVAFVSFNLTSVWLVHLHGYNFKKSQLYDSDYSQFLEEITWCGGPRLELLCWA